MRKRLCKLMVKFLERIKTLKIKWWYPIISLILLIPGPVNGLAVEVSKSVQQEDFKKNIQKVTDICNLSTKFIPRNMKIIITLSVILFWALWFYCRFIYKVKNDDKINMKILGHNTLGKSQFKFKDKYINNANLNIEELNLIEDFKGINGNYSDIHYIVKKQDEFIDNYIKSINNTDSYGYLGVSHTPLILRAGSMFGDESGYILFHKKRDFDYYEMLSNDNIYTPLIIEKKDIKKSPDELIVAISTTFQIKDEELEIFKPEQKSIIKFSTDKKGFDIILSKNQVDNYIKAILSEVRKIVKEKRIKKIHLVISSSVAFTFALGRSFSNNYDPEIIIYHYDMKTQEKYPWGLSLFNKYSNCMVVTK